MNRYIHIIAAVIIVSFSLSACTAGRSSGKGKSSDQKSASVGESAEFQKHFFDGQERKSVGDFEKAYKQFERCTVISPKNSVPFFELARIDHQMERVDIALKNINTALKLSPDNYWYHRTHAQFLLDFGMFAEAEKELEWLIRDHPDELDAYYDLAATFLYREDGKGAIKAYERLEERIGVDPELSFQKQRIFMLMGQPDKALEEINKLIAVFPEPEFYGQKASLLMDMGRAVEAEKTLLKIIEIDESNGTAYLLLSRIYARDGREEESWEALRKSFLSPEVSIDEKIGILLRFFSASEFDREARDRAYLLLEKLELLHPDDPKMHSMYGDYLLREGDFAGARDRFAAAVKVDEGRQLIWMQLVELDAQIGDWKSLVNHADQARELFPSQPVFYFMLGLGHLQEGNAQEAIDALNIGKSYVIEDKALLAQFWSSIGEAHNELKEFKKSDDAFEKSLKLVPDDPLVMNNYAYYLSLRGKHLERAAELSKKSNELVPGTPSFQDTYGWVLFKQGKHEQALEWIGKAIADGGADGLLMEHYGDVLFHLSRLDEAMQYWKEARDTGGAGPMIEKKIADRTYYDDL